MNKVITIKPEVNIQKVDTLVFASLLYLLIPNLLFIVAWFKPVIACSVLCLLAYAIHSFFRGQKFEFRAFSKNLFSSKLNLQLLLVAVFVCFFTGTGILLPEGDLPKHHGILKLLIEREWPIILQSNGDDFYLVYYIAWYLPAALVAKLFGLNFAIPVLIVESIVGVFLTLKWVLRLSKLKKNWLLPICIFFLLDGQSTLIAVFNHLSSIIQGVPFNFRQFIYDVTWQTGYYDFFLRKFSTAFDLAFVPQQVLGTWLTTSLILHELYERKNLCNVLLFFSLNALWSILGTIGILPIVLVGLFQLRGRGLISSINIGAALPLGLLLLCYFSSHLPIDEKGWIWEMEPTKNLSLRVITFIFFEFGIISLLIHKQMIKGDWKQLWLVVNISLMLLSCYVLGMYNDLLMRASVPLHFVFVLCVIKFYQKYSFKYKHYFLYVLLSTCSISFFLMEATLYYRRVQYGLPLMQENKVFGEVDADNWFYRQYLGETDSFYGKYLSK